MSVRSALGLALCAVLALGAGAASVQARSRARASAATPLVQGMIVGSTGAALFGPRAVAAPEATVRVGKRSCNVAAGTPLAVLAAAARLGGPSFSLRDYGRCGSSPTSSAQLFVYSLGGETNRGQNGWEYKVNGTSGTTGAGDPSGPSGNGRRLQSGQQVLWFWCAASGGGCERTLEVRVAATIVSRGGSLNVTVLGRDNEGHAQPVAGAIVSLGSDFASTATNGRATLIVPSERGTYQLSTKRHALVPSFPETISVR